MTTTAAEIAGFEVMALELPFRKPFKHAAAERSSSYSLYVKCRTSSGAVGYGEALPREYVTGESRDGAMRLLADTILPRLVGRSFASMGEVRDLLALCDGQAPEGWVPRGEPHVAAWCAVDLALLDACGRHFGERIRLNDSPAPAAGFRYSPVLSSDKGWKLFKNLALIRLAGFRQVKLKLDKANQFEAARLARRVLGRSFDVRVDANMAWSVSEAAVAMRQLARSGIRSFEQPVAAEDMNGLAWLVRETKLGVMADESLNTKASLDRLLAARACTAVNIRVSKCGGLLSSWRRLEEARESGLVVQVGCQVGESSLLSAAQLILLAAAGDAVTYGEGCFGRHLLREDPAKPMLQFRLGGKPPALPDGPGLGVSVDEACLRRYTVARRQVGQV